MKRNFNTWLSNFCDSISDYRYYVDFNLTHFLLLPNKSLICLSI